MEAQALFDQIVNGLRAQGGKAEVFAIDPSGETVVSCRYRTSDGRKCAAGQALLDEEYDPLMEGNSIGSVLDDESFAPTIRQRLLPHTGLLFTLQRVHDQAIVMDWEKEFQSAADTYQLIYTPPSAK